MGSGRGRDLSRRGALREILFGSLTVGVGLGAMGLERLARRDEGRWSDAPIPERRVLGSSGLEVSPIALGVNDQLDERIVRTALDGGINLIETSRQYSEGRAEEMLGRVLGDVPRDSYVLATKFPAPYIYSEIIRSVEHSLRALRTDHLDLLLVHGSEREDLPVCTECDEALADLKRAGKIRLSGLATHRLQFTVDHVIRTRDHEVVMVFFNALSPEEDIHLLDAAHAAGVGTIAMKVHFGRPRHAAREAMPSILRYVLSNRFIDSATLNIHDTLDVKRYLEAIQRPFDEDDQWILAEMTDRIEGEHCRSCYGCVGDCPAGLAVPEVLRSVLYLREYGEPERARTHFRSQAPRGIAEVCAGCETCRTRCRYGLDIPSRLAEAQGLFTFA